MLLIFAFNHDGWENFHFTPRFIIQVSFNVKSLRESIVGFDNYD